MAKILQNQVIYLLFYPIYDIILSEKRECYEIYGYILQGTWL